MSNFKMEHSHMTLELCTLGHYVFAVGAVCFSDSSLLSYGGSSDLQYAELIGDYEKDIDHFKALIEACDDQKELEKLLELFASTSVPGEMMAGLFEFIETIEPDFIWVHSVADYAQLVFQSLNNSVLSRYLEEGKVLELSTIQYSAMAGDVPDLTRVVIPVERALMECKFLLKYMSNYFNSGRNTTIQRVFIEELKLQVMNTFTSLLAQKQA